MIDDLLQRIEAYMKRNDMSGNRFSVHSCGHNSIVCEIRRGRKIKPETRAKIEAFMAGPVPPKPVPTSTVSPYKESDIHDNVFEFRAMVREGSARLLARMVETGQCRRTA